MFSFWSSRSRTSWSGVDNLSSPVRTAPEYKLMRDYLRRLYRFLLPLLYGRSRFKLFLSATFGDIQLRMLSLASVTDYFSAFVRPVVVKAPFGKSMLVVAPHQDDEAIGCGGALALQLRSGHAAAIVMLQDGGDEHEALGISRQAMMELRNQESCKAAAAIGLDPPAFLNHAQLAESAAEASREVLGILAERKIDAVFVPFVLDAHPDHRTANYILAEALKHVSWDVRIFGYEVWGLCVPNVMVVIDEVIEDKMRMLSCFTYANGAVDYVHSTRGLNMYHSRMLGAGQCRYAERFFEIPRLEYIELVERLRTAGSPATQPVQIPAGHSGQ
jgi:LmbE family N-acetylglucosaminyl deacetylase